MSAADAPRPTAPPPGWREVPSAPDQFPPGRWLYCVQGPKYHPLWRPDALIVGRGATRDDARADALEQAWRAHQAGRLQ